jgi:hypothetical protein
LRGLRILLCVTGVLLTGEEVSGLLQNPRKPKQIVSFFGRSLEMSQENAGGEPGHGDAVTAVAKREEMVREVAVQAYVRQAINSRVVGDIPRPLGHGAGNSGVKRGQFVHELTGPLNEHLVSGSCGNRRLIGTGKQHAIVLEPPEKVRGMNVVTQGSSATSELTPYRRW